jgi:hypothetical protein
MAPCICRFSTASTGERHSTGGCSCFDGCIVAFEGEAWDAHGLPLLWKFDKQEELLLQCRWLTASALHHASVFYRDGDKDNRFHTCRTPPPPGWHGETIKTCHCLIPIPVGWAHMFLDCPSMGTAFRQTIQLMLSAEAAEWHHLRPFCEGFARACGSPDPRATEPCSTLNSQWRRVAYTKATPTLATAAWEGHCPASCKPPPPRQKLRPPSHFDLIFGGTAREEDGNQEWGDNLGYNRPNTPHHEANQRILTPRGAHGTQAPRAPAPVTTPMGLDMALLITTLLKGQSDAQVAQANANHANLIAFHTATAQALAAKGGNK